MNEKLKEIMDIVPDFKIARYQGGVISKETVIEELQTLIIQAKEEVSRHIEQRLEQHRDNLRLWENGTLVPTAQDEQEVEVTKEGLRAAIYELEKIKETLSPNKSDGGER